MIGFTISCLKIVFLLRNHSFRVEKFRIAPRAIENWTQVCYYGKVAFEFPRSLPEDNPKKVKFTIKPSETEYTITSMIFQSFYLFRVIISLM